MTVCLSVKTIADSRHSARKTEQPAVARRSFIDIFGPNRLLNKPWFAGYLPM